MALHQESGQLAATASPLRVDGDVVVTARMVGDAFELRCFNPTDQTAEITISFGDNISFSRINLSIWRVALDRPSRITDSKASLRLEPRKIATYRFQ